MSELSICIIIASKGRPDDLNRWGDRILQQSKQPSHVIFSVTQEADLPVSCPLAESFVVIMGSQGLPAQRNRALKIAAQKADLVAFFDDDYIPSRYCLEDIAHFMELHKDVAGVTGLVLMDGIKTSGLNTEVALEMISRREVSRDVGSYACKKVVGLYGCNMIFRSSKIHGIEFDERLPLYAWQEDIDFSVQVSRVGRVVKTDCFFGVHLGSKGSRVSGFNFGYSQIANPFYLIKKGTMPLLFGLKLAVKNFISNHLMLLSPEPWIDRKGRVKGNWLGIKDVIFGRSDPRRILEFIGGKKKA